MSSIILVIHIVLAIAALGASIGVIVRPGGAKRLLQATWAAFGGVVLTGAMLVVAHPGSLGKLCAMSTVYLVVLAVAQHRYKTVSTIQV